MSVVSKQNIISSLAILIPVHNNISYTKKCLRNLSNTLKYTSLKSKIVVIDDGSNDGTGAWIRENYPSVELLDGDGNLWWSGSINLGAAHAFNNLNVDYILWWNNDIVTNESYFELLNEVLNETDKNTIIGSKIMQYQDKNIVWSMGGYFNPKVGTKNMYGFNKPDGDEYNEIKEVDWLTGMGTIIHKNIFNRIGNIDDKHFPQYDGDCDYTYRAKKQGVALCVDPRLIIFNDTSNTGFHHQYSFRRLLTSFFHVKSKYNINKALIFYWRHTKSPLAYLNLIKNYLIYILGFLKWKILSVVGIKRENK